MMFESFFILILACPPNFKLHSMEINALTTYYCEADDHDKDL